MLRVVLLLGGAALLVLLLWHLGPAAVLDAFNRVGWYFGLVLLLGAAHQATRALALHACVLRRNVLRYRDALAIRLSGEAVQSLTSATNVRTFWLVRCLRSRPRPGCSKREG